MGRQAAILDIDSSVMRRLKREATRRGKTMSELVETRPGSSSPSTNRAGGAGNRWHEAVTAILMLEGGIRAICTRDADSHRFPFVETIDSLAPSPGPAEGQRSRRQRARRA